MKHPNPLATRAVVALCGATVLAGCSVLPESKKIDYKSTGKAPSLEVPPDLTSPAKDERYAVPDTAGKGGSTYSMYNAERGEQASGPKVKEVLPDVDKAKIERSGSQRWLVVGMPPDKVWPLVKDFWQESGFIINLEVPEAGVMETDWAENRAKIPQDFIRNTLGKVLDSLYSTAERDKFRTRLEPGSDPNTTDIFISHRGMSEVFVTEGKEQTRWQPRDADPDLEAEMLRRLMSRFGTEDRRVQAAASNPELQLADRARVLRTNDGSNTLEVDERFDRAWRRVGLALDRVGFTVEDRDRTKGMYFVRYVDPDADNKKEEKSFVSKLAFWKSDDKDAGPRNQYRIQIQELGSKTTVQVLAQDGSADKTETGRRIITLLLGQLK